MLVVHSESHDTLRVVVVVWFIPRTQKGTIRTPSTENRPRKYVRTKRQKGKRRKKRNNGDVETIIDITVASAER